MLHQRPINIKIKKKTEMLLLDNFLLLASKTTQNVYCIKALQCYV